MKQRKTERLHIPQNPWTFFEHQKSSGFGKGFVLSPQLVFKIPDLFGISCAFALAFGQFSKTLAVCKGLQKVSLVLREAVLELDQLAH